MSIKNPYDFLNTPAFDTIQQMQEQLNNSTFSITMKKLQKTIDAVKVPTNGITAAIQAYQDSIAPLTATIQNINSLYAPILEQTRKYEDLYNNSMVSVLQSSIPAMKAMAELDFSAIQSIANAFSEYDLLYKSILENINFDTAAQMYDEGMITDEDIAEEFKEIVAKRNFSLSKSWDDVKKSKWFLAIRCILVVLMFFCSPVIDKVKDNVLETLGVNEFWEESGIYEWLDELFGIENVKGTVTELEAKETIDNTKTGNLSKQKREDLIAKIGEIRNYISTAPQDENTENLLTYLSELEKDVCGKKYGLVFEQHREDIDEVLDAHVPVLTENKNLYISNGGQMNVLIEGDNLASLKLLEKTYKGKINLIYIDPPYNTRKDGFTYSDTFVDGNDTFRHSKWLSFMQRRLHIVHRLLSRNGIIMISIDENEFAQVKLLCDEIFNEENFVECIIWNKRVPKNDKGIGNIHEYILTYAKNSDYKYKFTVLKDGLKDIDDLLATCKANNISIEETEKRLKKLYKKNKYDRAITLYNAVDENYRVWGKINMSWPNGNTFGPRYNVLHPITKKPVRVPDRGWRWSEETFLEAVDYEHVVQRFDGSYMCGNIWFAKDENMQPSSIKYLDEVNRMLLRSIISLKSDGGIELEKYFDKKSVFAYPKSVELLRMLIDSITYNQKDCQILDFFAGSGTTGHAVMKLNAEDGGNRKFILCTNNENNICRDVTYERIKRVIEKEHYAASLKYYKVDYIPISDRLYYEYADELLKHIRELVELENGINFNGNAEIAIVLTEEELDEFIANIDENRKCAKLYLGHDILIDSQQAQILKDRKITINIIPDYYYKELEG